MLQDVVVVESHLKYSILWLWQRAMKSNLVKPPLHDPAQHIWCFCDWTLNSLRPTPLDHMQQIIADCRQLPRKRNFCEIIQGIDRTVTRILELDYLL